MYLLWRCLTVHWMLSYIHAVRIWSWCIISDITDFQYSVNCRLILWLLSCLSFMFIIMFSSGFVSQYIDDVTSQPFSAYECNRSSYPSFKAWLHIKDIAKGSVWNFICGNWWSYCWSPFISISKRCGLDQMTSCSSDADFLCSAPLHCFIMQAGECMHAYVFCTRWCLHCICILKY